MADEEPVLREAGAKARDVDEGKWRRNYFRTMSYSSITVPVFS